MVNEAIDLKHAAGNRPKPDTGRLIKALVCVAVTIGIYCIADHRLQCHHRRLHRRDSVTGHRHHHLEGNGGELLRIGLICGIVTVAIYLTIGMGWWKIIGIW